MDTDSLVYDIKTEDFYEDIADNVPARFDTSGYCPNRSLPVGLNKKVIGLMKDEIGGKIMTEFVALRPKLVMTEEKYLCTVMCPSFKSGVLFGENLMGKIKVVMNKPVYLGQAILDLSKIVTYEFHYDYMVPKYGDRLKLCYMDTDSLVYHIRTKDFYADTADDVQTRLIHLVISQTDFFQ